MRPLDRIGSIKLKLSIVIVVAVLISATVSSIGWRTGLAVWVRPIIAAVIAVAIAYPISRGITAPLREMAAAARAMEDGDFTQPVSVTSRDEVGDLARAFDQMRAELAEVDRQRRALIANVSHELRTPLTALRARLENIVDGVEPNDVAHAKASLAEIERLSALVERVLDLSRLESGASPLRVERFDLEPLLREAAASVAADGPADRVVLHVAPSTDFRGDRGRVHQLVANLVDNALRFSPPETEVHVTAVSSSAGVVISVLDHGPGIPAADRDRVFERFYRVDAPRSAATGGAGLGLAIVAEIVELHGGAIEIGANQPIGCRVVVRLPDAAGGLS